MKNNVAKKPGQIFWASTSSFSSAADQSVNFKVCPQQRFSHIRTVLPRNPRDERDLSPAHGDPSLGRPLILAPDKSSEPFDLECRPRRNACRQRVDWFRFAPCFVSAD